MMFQRLAFLLLFLALPAAAREGSYNFRCTAANTPYTCCHAPFPTDPLNDCTLDNIFVTAATHDGTAGGPYPCTGANNPHACCGSSPPGTNTCGSVVNGADVCVGLEQCENTDGCVLQLPEG